MKSDIVLNHPDGKFTLQDLQNDVDVAKSMYPLDKWTFTTKTVQILIDKIMELSSETQPKL